MLGQTVGVNIMSPPIPNPQMWNLAWNSVVLTDSAYEQLCQLWPDNVTSHGKGQCT